MTIIILFRGSIYDHIKNIYDYNKIIMHTVVSIIVLTSIKTMFMTWTILHFLLQAIVSILRLPEYWKMLEKYNKSTTSSSRGWAFRDSIFMIIFAKRIRANIVNKYFHSYVNTKIHIHSTFILWVAKIKKIKIK